jgi:CheY-like chemotaxis protein
VAKSLRILVVDDQPEVGDMLSAVLHAEGHEPVCCRSGVEAVQTLQTAPSPFDLLITDHYMPGGLNGLDLVRIARSNGFERQIVATSGAFTHELKEQYKQYAVLCFLPKPIDLKLLHAFIKGAIIVPSLLRKTEPRLSA